MPCLQALRNSRGGPSPAKSIFSDVSRRFEAFVYSSDSITHVVDTNPFLTLIVLALVMAMMLYSDSVKRFYTPSMMEVKPVRDWAKYIFVGSLYSEEYKVVRGS